MGQPTLTPPPQTLKGPSNHPLPVKGYFQGTLRLGDKESTQKVYVVQNLHQQLLGRPVIKALGLIVRAHAINRPRSVIWLTIPRNHLSSLTSCRLAFFMMPWTLSGSGLMPLLSIWCPRNLTCLLKNLHFSGFRVIPDSCIVQSTLFRLFSCSYWVAPNTSTSFIMQTVPGRPASIWDI